MQQGIVKQIQFSLRRFHLFIHLQDFYWTPTIYGHSEQGAGDIRLLPTVSTQEKRVATRKLEHSWTNALMEEHRK